MSTTLRGREAGRTVGLTAGDGRVTISPRVSYVVLSDTNNESLWNVLRTPGLPIPQITTLAGAVCTGLEAKEEKDQPKVWRVQATFEGEATQEEPDPEEPTNDPLQWRPIWKGNSTYVERFSVLDANGKSILTPAGTFFSEPIMRLVPIVSHTFTQYEAPSLTPLQIAQRNNCVNNGTFRGYPKHQLKLLVKDFEKGYVNDVLCWKINYEAQLFEGDDSGTYFEWNGSSWVSATSKSGWREMRLGLSSHYRVSAGSASLRPFLDDRGAARTNGMVNADGTQKTSGDPIVLGVDVCKPIDFSFIRSA
jgi:hypothetical protein